MQSLYWETEYDDNDNSIYVASSCVDLGGEDDCDPAKFRICRALYRDAIVVSVAKSDAELVGTDTESYSTLDDAKAFCEETNRKLGEELSGK